MALSHQSEYKLCPLAPSTDTFHGRRLASSRLDSGKLSGWKPSAFFMSGGGEESRQSPGLTRRDDHGPQPSVDIMWPESTSSL